MPAKEKARRGGVLSFDVRPTPDAWRVVVAFRSGVGGVENETYTRGKFEAVLTLMNQLIHECGVER